jgi:hypothetical protein
MSRRNEELALMGDTNDAGEEELEEQDADEEDTRIPAGELTARAGYLPSNTSQDEIRANLPAGLGLFDFFMVLLALLLFVAIFPSSLVANSLTYLYFSAGHLLLGPLIVLAGRAYSSTFTLCVLIYAAVVLVADGVGLTLRILNIIQPCSPSCGLFEWLALFFQLTFAFLALFILIAAVALMYAQATWEEKGMLTNGDYVPVSPPMTTAARAPPSSGRRLAPASGGKPGPTMRLRRTAGKHAAVV